MGIWFPVLCFIWKIRTGKARQLLTNLSVQKIREKSASTILTISYSSSAKITV